jgi:Icc-related predicted phosphoesterase
MGSRPSPLRVLFASDLHALKPAFALFAKKLAQGPCDAGVLSGDLLDDIRLPDAWLVERLGIDPDELLEELPDAEDSKPWLSAVRRVSEINLRGLRLLEREFLDLLAEAGKPIFLIPGNHDRTSWAGRGRVESIDGRRAELESWNFVGFSPTLGLACRSARTPEQELGHRLEALAPLVDGRTVLVTHNPAWRMLDEEGGRRQGSQALRRFILDRRPRWHLFGHVHAAFGKKGRSVNGAFPASLAFWDIDLRRGAASIVSAPVVITAPRWA